MNIPSGLGNNEAISSIEVESTTFYRGKTKQNQRREVIYCHETFKHLEGSVIGMLSLQHRSRAALLPAAGGTSALDTPKKKSQR